MGDAGLFAKDDPDGEAAAALIDAAVCCPNCSAAFAALACVSQYSLLLMLKYPSIINLVISNLIFHIMDEKKEIYFLGFHFLPTFFKLDLQVEQTKHSA